MALRFCLKLLPVTCVGLAVLTTILGLGWAQSATAHEGATVGEYTLMVGFENEPAYAEFPNAIQVIVGSTRADQPLAESGAVPEANLKVTITHSETRVARQFNLVPKNGTDNQYHADFIPAAPGNYELHITGTLGGLTVDHFFISGDGSFSSVLAPTGIYFPDATISSQHELTNQIASLEQDTRRLERSLLGLTIAVVVLGIFTIGYTGVVYFVFSKPLRKKLRKKKI